jgi:hypothetical protein
VVGRADRPKKRKSASFSAILAPLGSRPIRRFQGDFARFGVVFLDQIAPRLSADDRGAHNKDHG